MAETCGTGLIVGRPLDPPRPLPGDPNTNNVVLSAHRAYGGVNVSWTYPLSNPNAVAHTILYRALSGDFNTAIERSIVAGNYFFDALNDNLTYYYWIKIVSVNGTVSNLIGPAVASVVPRIEDILDELTGRIELGLLAQTLRSEIDRIGLLDSAINREISDRLTDMAATAAFLATLNSSVIGVEALVLRETTRLINEMGAIINVIDAIGVRVGTNTAAIVTESEVRATAISAEAAQRLTISSQLNNPTTGLAVTRASLINDYYTKVGVDGAIATNASQLRAYSNISSKNFSQPTAPLNRGLDPTTGAIVLLQVGDTWINTTNNANTLMVWTGSIWIPKVDSSIAAVDARVFNVETTKIGYCTVSGKTTDHSNKALCERNFGIWNVGLALASAVKQVGVTGPNGESAIVEQAFLSQMNLNGTLKSQYTIKIDNGGLISGFGLASESSLTGPTTSEFGVLASRFFVGPPTVVQSWAPTQDLYEGYVWRDTSVSPSVIRYYREASLGVLAGWSTTPTALPFVVQATPVIENGVVIIPAGVYMKSAFIRNLSVSTLMIDNNAVTVPIGETIVDSSTDSLTVNWVVPPEISGGMPFFVTAFISCTRGSYRHYNNGYDVGNGINNADGSVTYKFWSYPGEHSFQILLNDTQGFSRRLSILVLGIKK